MFVTVAGVPMFPEVGKHEFDKFGGPMLARESGSGSVASTVCLLVVSPLLAPPSFPDVFPADLVLLVDELTVRGPGLGW